MKGLLIIGFAALSSIGCYFIYLKGATARTEQMLAQPDAGLEWLRAEFHLSDAQFARIHDLEQQYSPRCDLMCQKIAEANQRLETVIQASSTYSPAVDAAMNASANVQFDCRRALLAHVYAVSAEMTPSEGARYLQMMAARIIEPGLGHQAVISQSPK